MGNAKNYRQWEKDLDDFLYRTRRYDLFKCEDLGEYSEPGESERDFRIRLAERAREERDLEIEKLRRKYESKIRTLEDRVRRAEQKVERERQEASSAKMQSAISFGATILSAVFGRKVLSSTNIGRASTAARGFDRASKQRQDVTRAEEDMFAYQEQLEDLERQLQDEIDHIADKLDPLTVPLETIQLKPRKTDIEIRLLALAWIPCSADEDDHLQPLI